MAELFALGAEGAAGAAEGAGAAGGLAEAAEGTMAGAEGAGANAAESATAKNAPDIEGKPQSGSGSLKLPNALNPAQWLNSMADSLGNAASTRNKRF